jgi:hypothetical protein
MSGPFAIIERASIALLTVLLISLPKPGQGAERANGHGPAFQTSDRCIACHNGLTTPSGRDVSIGFDWRASVMANSSRDPYWQASVRREAIDHHESQAAIEDECSACHMPVTRYEAKLRGQLGEVFSHLPFDEHKKQNPKPKMASTVRSATRLEEKSWARARVSTADLLLTLRTFRKGIRSTVPSIS